jgi:hypothetical protein
LYVFEKIETFFLFHFIVPPYKAETNSHLSRDKMFAPIPVQIPPHPDTVSQSFIDNIDDYKTITIRESNYYIGIDNTDDCLSLYPTMQRSPLIAPVATTPQLIDVVSAIDCVAKVVYVNPCTTVVWVNIQTPHDFDSRPFHMRTGVFGNPNFHYPVPITTADEVVGSIVFNLNLKISSIERAFFTLTNFGKTYVPYIINSAP